MTLQAFKKTLTPSASLVAQLVKNPLAMRETWVRSPGEGIGYPLQYSGLENSMESMGHRKSDMNERLSLHLTPSLRYGRNKPHPKSIFKTKYILKIV